jgi:hypothetical protein
MELRFESGARRLWRECLHTEERRLVELEGVVPDVGDDVGRIAAIRCAVHMTAKELTPRGLRVEGEVEAVLLCITENADAVQSVRLTKGFESEIDAPGMGADEAQAFPRVLRAEGKVLNPRKLAVRAELGVEVSLWKQEEAVLTLLPAEEDAALLCGLCAETETVPASAVGEKSFALTESFVFPPERPAPRRILCAESAFSLADTTRLGSRLIVKGTLLLSVLYEAEGYAWPLRQEFTAPLSQIVDLGAEDAVCCTLRCDTSSLYLDLAEGIGGPSLSAEVHAVLQAVCRVRESLRCLTDAYSNAMPLRFETCAVPLPQAAEPRRLSFTASEPVAAGEDCAEILTVLPALSFQGTAVTAGLDLLYRTKNGEIAAAHRELALRGEAPGADARVLSLTWKRCELRIEGEGVQCELEAELRVQELGERTLEAICAVELDEENPIARASLPTVTLVRADGESLWELARRYHSSVAAIENANPGGAAGEMLLIPRA